MHSDSEAIRGRTVDALMISGKIEWDIDLIKDIFLERDANLILSVPLGTTEADVWFWKWDKLGHYTVKSAYEAIK